MLHYILAISVLTILNLATLPIEPVTPVQGVAIAGGAHTNADSVVYESESLVIRKISSHGFVHTSYLNTESFGRVPCNGMVVVSENEAVVFDTPADDQGSEELIRFLTENMKHKIKGIVSTHFHADCVGGLKVFHRLKIPSYAYTGTIALLRSGKDKVEIPKKGFDDKLELKVGSKKVYAAFLGEGHTRDNTVGYFPDDKIMFGGCLIKEAGAGKGYLEDANIKAWPETVRKVKAKYPDVKIVIPGHGKAGGPELLDYTIELFE